MSHKTLSTSGLVVGATFTIIKPIRYQEYWLRPGYTGIIESVDKAGDVLVKMSFPKDGDQRIWILNQHMPSVRIDEEEPGQLPSTPRIISKQMGTFLCTAPGGEVLETCVSPVCNGVEERGHLCTSAKRVGHEVERAGFTHLKTCALSGSGVQSRLVVGCRVTLEQPLRGLLGAQALLGAGLQADICCIDESGDVLADFGTPYMQEWISGADLWKLRVTKVAARRFWDHGRVYPCKSGKAYTGGNSSELPSHSNFLDGGAVQFGYADGHVRPAGLPSCRTCEDLDSTFASDSRAMGNADLSDASDADSWSTISFRGN